MGNPRNRSRVLYFRVSEEEYQQINDLCEQRGARNVSDLIRSAMDMMMRNQQKGFEKEIARRLDELEQSIDRLSRNVAKRNGQAAN